MNITNHILPKADIISHGIHSNPIKSALALFIAELLSVVLREYQEDKALYLFLRQSIEKLNDATIGVANFHLCFLFYLKIALDDYVLLFLIH